MKAIVQTEYGAPLNVLSLRELPQPAPRGGEVLVRMRAAGLHRGDCFSVRGAPFPVRFATGLRRPKVGIPGYDLAGVVEGVGIGVERFRAGDEVFGAATGTCAEYVAVSEETLTKKPDDVTFEDAAAVPTSALAALHGLRDAGKIAAGQHVLVNGASGGVGSFAVQIAKLFDAEVTGVCSGRNVEMVRSLGADHVIDYEHEDFTLGSARYDLIFDNVENRSLEEIRRVLAPEGTLVLNSGSGAEGLALVVRMVKPLVLSPFSRQHFRRYISTPKQADLALIRDWMAQGKLHAAVDKTYGLDQVPEALAYLDGGRASGKVVVTV